MDNKTILLVEDQNLVRESLIMLIENHPGYKVSGGVADGFSAVKMAAKLKPDLVLMDLALPGLSGIDALKEIKRLLPAIKIMIITGHHSDNTIRDAFEAGADGYLLKGAHKNELFFALETVFNGKSYISPEISEHIIINFLGAKPAPGQKTAILSDRENEVLKLIAEGFKNREIAESLFISIKTN